MAVPCVRIAGSGRRCRVVSGGSAARAQVGAAVGADAGPQGWAHRCTAAPQLMSAAKQWPAHSAAL